MLSLTEILALIQGVLAFPGECLALVRMLQGTPEQHREEIMASVQKAADGFAQTGRPQ